MRQFKIGEAAAVQNRLREISSDQSPRLDSQSARILFAQLKVGPAEMRDLLVMFQRLGTQAGLPSGSGGTGVIGIS